MLCNKHFNTVLAQNTLFYNMKYNIMCTEVPFLDDNNYNQHYNLERFQIKD